MAHVYRIGDYVTHIAEDPTRTAIYQITEFIEPRTSRDDHVVALKVMDANPPDPRFWSDGTTLDYEFIEPVSELLLFARAGAGERIFSVEEVRLAIEEGQGHFD